MKDLVKLQESISDCGACSLYSIIKYYKGYVPLEIIKIDTLTNQNGTNFYNIKKAAEKYGFSVEGCCHKNCSKITPPFIVQLKLKNGLLHFVVLYEINSNNYICMDPSVGIKKYSLDEFNRAFTGNILKLSPVKSIVKYSQNNHLFSLIKKLIKKYYLKTFLIVILSIIIIGLSLTSTYVIKLVLNQTNKRIIILFISLLIIKNFLNYYKNNLLAHLNQNYSNSLIIDYISYYFFLPLKYLQLKNVGEIISRIDDFKDLKDYISKEIVNMILSFLMIIPTVLIFYFFNKNISICLLIFSIIFIIVIYASSKQTFSLYHNSLDSETDFKTAISEYVSKINTIKNLGNESFFLKKLNFLNNNNNYNSFKIEKYLNKVQSLINIFNDIGIIIIVLLSISYKESIENVLIYILYYNYYIDNLNYLVSIIPNIQYLKSLFNKINGIYYLKQEERNIGKKFVNGTIKIDNLSYKFNLTNILDHISINLNQQDKVLLVGNNGSGKSTLLNCLTNNIDEYDGNITINNILINDIQKDSLKDNICFVIQNDCLFIDSIKNNIVLEKEYDDEKYKLICKVLYLEELINKKGGDNFLINDNLSGGEYQRIVLARALYRNTPILLLDESLSEVSYNLRNNIVKNINKYYKDKTIIYVSHYKEKNKFNQIIDLTARKDKVENAK